MGRCINNNQLTNTTKTISPFNQIIYIVVSLDSNDQIALQLNNELKINNLFAITGIIYLYIWTSFNVILFYPSELNV